jgi:hypothetical protein
MVVPPIIAFVDRHRASILVVIIFLFPFLGYLGAPSARRLVGKGEEVGIYSQPVSCSQLYCSLVVLPPLFPLFFCTIRNSSFCRWSNSESCFRETRFLRHACIRFFFGKLENLTCVYHRFGMGY